MRVVTSRNSIAHVTTTPLPRELWSTQAVSVPMPEPVRSIAAAYEYTCALLQSGKLACWGDNFAGHLGVPALNNTPVPRLVRE